VGNIKVAGAIIPRAAAISSQRQFSGAAPQGAAGKPNYCLYAPKIGMGSLRERACAWPFV
jgi:hypothetical protein